MSETDMASNRGWPGMPGYMGSIILVAAASFVCWLLQPYINPANMVMVYLLAVVVAAIRLGKRPAVFTALAGVLAFDFFFVPPRFTFRVADKEYVITFLGLFTVGTVISTLVTDLRERSVALQERERQTSALYHLSRDLVAATDSGAIFEAIIRHVQQSFHADVVLFLPKHDKLEAVTDSSSLGLDDNEWSVAQWTFTSGRVAGLGAGMFSAAKLIYLPLRTPATTLGVMGVKLPGGTGADSDVTRQLLEAFATQVAMAMERARLVMQAEQAQMLQARENLEKALLNSVSHDLRTPLVTITGGLSSVLDEGDRLDISRQRELLQAAREEAERLNRFVGNLLDMTRLEAGQITLKKEMSDVQDVIGCAIAALERRLEGRRVEVKLAGDLPMVPLDMVLMTQVLINLLDNALKYSPPGSTVEIAANSDGAWVTIEVSDRGPGIPEDQLEHVFTKFYRIETTGRAGGTGLGLPICKGIVEGHGGRINASNRVGGGLVVSVKVPIQELAHGAV